MKPYANKTFTSDPRMSDIAEELKEHKDECNKPVNWSDIQNKPEFTGDGTEIEVFTEEEIQKLWDSVEVK